MRYYVTYDKKNGSVTGYLTSTAHITPVPRGVEEDIVEVTTDDEIKALSSFEPYQQRLNGRVESGVLSRLVLEPAFRGSVALSCDQPDLDGDGVAELPADGKSEAKITASLVDGDGKPLRAEGIKIDFRVTRGKLSTRQQAVKESGAEVRLRSADETTRARITAKAEGFREAGLLIEFIPPEEHRELLAGATKTPG